EQRLLDELVDDARLHRAVALALLERALHERRDVEGADRDAEGEEELGQVAAQVASVPVTLRRLARERPVDDPLELRGHLLVDLRDARHLRRLHLLDGLEIGVSEEESLPRQELPEDDAYGEDVGASVDLLAHGRLGREVREL